MPFNLTAFRGQMVFDGARPNLFEVFLSFPSFSIPAAGVRTPFMVKSAQLPGSTVGQVSVPYFGREVKLAGNRTFPEWTVTVINDEDFLMRGAFEQWLMGINSHKSNLRDPAAANSLGYTQDATVIQYSKVGVPLRTYKFVAMFPTDIAPIDLDWGSNDSIEEYSVTFAYQWWEATGTGGDVS